VLTLETCKKREEEREVRRAEDRLGYDATVNSRAPKLVYLSPFEPMSELQREGEPAEDEDKDEGGVRHELLGA
jgi:hypothetical protein